MCGQCRALHPQQSPTWSDEELYRTRCAVGIGQGSTYWGEGARSTEDNHGSNPKHRQKEGLVDRHSWHLPVNYALTVSKAVEIGDLFCAAYGVGLQKTIAYS